MDSTEKYKVIGVMSGTSLDGVDLACCTLRKRESRWVYTIEAAQTVHYSKIWKQKLSAANELSGLELAMIDREYGKYLGLLVQAFIIKNKVRGVNFISSHGHTIFHNPPKKLTSQLGNGYELHAATGLPVVFDFRSLDVALGGQGAPLVPVGDKYLFQEYDCCLNLGGIANISFDQKGKRHAFDICFVNMGLNYLSLQLGLDYDKNGLEGSKGEMNAALLVKIEKCYEAFSNDKPSLGSEIFSAQLKPILDKSKISVKDKLATFVESVGMEILKSLPKTKNHLSVLVTGGGAHNAFLMYRMMELMSGKATLILPEPDVVNFKEALIFSFLGVLKLRGEANCLKTVTGAKSDNCGGVAIGF
jgi:anhydro-N-acetylmuramic acid kinase